MSESQVKGGESGLASLFPPSSLLSSRSVGPSTATSAVHDPGYIQAFYDLTFFLFLRRPDRWRKRVFFVVEGSGCSGRLLAFHFFLAPC